MAARSLTRTVVGMGLRPFCVYKTTLCCVALSHGFLSSAKTLTMALSHRSLLSLSTPYAKTLNLSHRSFPPPSVVSLSSSLRRQPMSSSSDLSPQLNELLVNFHYNYLPWDLRVEYRVKLEKLFEKDNYRLEDVEWLQWFYIELSMKRSEVVYLAEAVDKLLDWFEKDISNAKYTTLVMRKNLRILIKLNKKVENFENMFWTLYDIHEKAIRAKAPEPKDNNNKPRYLVRAHPGPAYTWKANDFIVKLNELLDWFTKETIEAYDTTQKLRKEYETLYANLLALERVEYKDEDKFDDHPRYKCLKEFEAMFWNLKKKQSKAILAKHKTNELAKRQAQAAKILYPSFVV